MAKIAVQSSLSSQFASKYAGKVRIDAARISRAASQTPYFSGTASTGAMPYAHSQNAEASGDRYDSLFYLFENGSLAAGSRVLLTLDATYDCDGDFATTADQAPLTYEVELAGRYPSTV